MEVVTAIARAHGVKPADALVETGHLQPDDIDGIGVEEALRRATNRQIFNEIETRSDMEATGMFGKSVGIINPRRVDNVIPLQSNSDREEGTPTVEPIIYDPLQDVAYGGEDEDALRKKLEGDWTDPDHPIP